MSKVTLVKVSQHVPLHDSICSPEPYAALWCNCLNCDARVKLIWQLSVNQRSNVPAGRHVNQAQFPVVGAW